jgi:DNA-binding transcriptional regulator GbsR (MarR family)
MNPDEGAYRWRIMGLKEDIEHEKEMIELGKKLMVNRSNEEKAEELISSAKENIKKLEEELSVWTQKHFEWLQENNARGA